MTSRGTSPFSAISKMTKQYPEDPLIRIVALMPQASIMISASGVPSSLSTFKTPSYHFVFARFDCWLTPVDHFRHVHWHLRMTRLHGAPVAPDPSRSPAAIDAQAQASRSKLPPNAPEVVAKNTVKVTDPARILYWHRDERNRQFNLLVRR